MTLQLPLFSALLLSACSPVVPAGRNETVPPPLVAAHQHLIRPDQVGVADTSRTRVDGEHIARMIKTGYSEVNAAPRLVVTLSWSF
jgi:hypothetical protein